MIFYFLSLFDLFVTFQKLFYYFIFLHFKAVLFFKAKLLKKVVLFCFIARVKVFVLK